MRKMSDRQMTLKFVGTQKLTQEYYRLYGRMDELLKQNPEILKWVHADLEAGGGKLKRNKEKVTSEGIMRMAVAQRYHEWSERELIVRIDDSDLLRSFCRFYCDALVAHNTYSELVNRIQPGTWEKINDLLGGTAREQKPCAGKQLRLDTTAVETNIHHPTDAWLLWDCVRVLSRILGQIRAVSREAVGNHRDRSGKAKTAYGRIARGGAKQHEATRKKLYGQLLWGVERVMAWARAVCERIETRKHLVDWVGAMELAGLAKELRHYLPLAEKCVSQARKRVLAGQKVPNAEKIFSIFEEHTELLIRGKSGKAVEFGHMVELHQDESGFITKYRVHEQRPAEAPLLKAAVEAHQERYGQVPERVCADRGFYSAAAVAEVKALGVKEVCVPKKGKRTAAEEEREHEEWFRQGQAFRAGIEGLISVLKRGYGWTRCLREGFKRFDSWVGSGVFVKNLVFLAGD